MVTSPFPSGLLRKQGLPLSNTGGRIVATIPVDPPALRPSLPAQSHLSIHKAVLPTSPAHSHLQDLSLYPFICSSDVSLGLLFTSIWPGQARDRWTLNSFLLPDPVWSQRSGAWATAGLPKTHTFISLLFFARLCRGRPFLHPGSWDVGGSNPALFFIPSGSGRRGFPYGNHDPS